MPMQEWRDVVGEVLLTAAAAKRLPLNQVKADWLDTPDYALPPRSEQALVAWVMVRLGHYAGGGKSASPAAEQ